MKKIEAIIPSSRLAAVKDALVAIGFVEPLLVSAVSGLDAGPLLCPRTGKSACPNCAQRLLAQRRRLKIEFLVGDCQAHRAIDAILLHGRADPVAAVAADRAETGERIIVLNVEASLTLSPPGQRF